MMQYLYWAVGLFLILSLLVMLALEDVPEDVNKRGGR